MTWFPIGPDFVDAPRDQARLRLSVRNELGRQAMISAIAVDPGNANVIYTIDTPVSGGSGVFRSADGGRSWTAISDILQVADPNFMPTCIAVNPQFGNYLYLGTSAGNVFVSNDSGQSWGPARNISTNKVVQIIVDPRTTANPATTVVYAGTWANGLRRSADNGTTWGATPLPGWISSMVFSMPAMGTAHCYAAVESQGVYHTTDPTAAWTPISGTLPAAGTFYEVRLELCRNNPNRVYAWYATSGGQNVGLYTSGSGPTGWTQIVSPTLPSPGQGTYSFALQAAPNSPGDGATDILFFASVGLYRSTDAGHTWAQWGDWFHADQHAIAFAPVNPPAGTIPTTLVGCDGGLAGSTRFADATFNFAGMPTAVNDGTTYDPTSGVAQNLNHGKLSAGVRHYHADPAVGAIGYIGCQDTGIAGHTSVLGWRGLADADGVAVATTPGSDGVKVWEQIGAPFSTGLMTDHGDFAPTWTAVALAGGDRVNSTSNHVLTIDHRCVAAVNPLTSSAAAIPAGMQTVTPQSMAFITAGTLLLVLDYATWAQELVTVSSVTATTFTATFANAYAANPYIEVLNALVSIIDQAGAATQVSQTFGSQPPWLVAASSTDPTLFCSATRDNRVFVTSGVVPGPGTVWAEATTAKPANASVSSVTIDPANNVYVLLTSVPGGSTTPLYKIAGGAWTAQSSAGLPAGPFGPLVADPVTPNTLYAAATNGVYRLSLAGATWTWTAMSARLPGTTINDLWAGNVGTVAAPKVLLRATVGGRGVYETDITAGAIDPPARPYVRDHFLDQGWIVPSPDGLVDPFHPMNGISVYHYQCADIKVDAQQAGPPPFLQTDPEGTLPLSPVLFDELQDDSQGLPSADTAMVHVQVHNRSYAALGGVSVWAVYTNASAGVPGLNQSAMMGNAFDFWSQFQPGGAIVPNLPMDSPWRSVGAPFVLPDIDVAHPQVASWNWAVPTLGIGDPGHYCMVVFVHSMANPIGETVNYSVDSITPTNPQIGQRNMHVVAMAGHAGARSSARVREYVEFHNAVDETRVSDLVFDLRPLPPQLNVWLRFSELHTVAPLHESLTGIEVTHAPGAADSVREALLAGVERAEELLELLERRLGGDGDDDDDRTGKRPAPIPLTPTVYRAKPGTLVTVRGVRLPAYGRAAALLAIDNAGGLPAGAEYRFQVQQVVRGRVLGGSTYVVRIAGQRAYPPAIVAPSHVVDPKTGRVPGRNHHHIQYVPPWLRDIVEEREEILGMFPAEHAKRGS